MSEMYVLTVIMLYTVFVLVITLTEAYPLLIANDDNSNELIYPQSALDDLVHKITLMILRINMKKDYRLNMKRRPPIILVAH